MKKLIFIFLILLYAFPLHSQCLNLDLVVVGDYSGSVHNHEDFVLDAIQSFALNVEGENVRMSVILFADSPNPVSELTSNKARLLLAIENQRGIDASGGTNIEEALQAAANVLLTESNNSRKLIILISDGATNSGEDSPTRSLTTARQLNSIGIGVCAVLIKSETQRPAFMREISGGCYVESSYENLTEELKNLDICL